MKIDVSKMSEEEKEFFLKELHGLPEQESESSGTKNVTSTIGAKGQVINPNLFAKLGRAVTGLSNTPIGRRTLTSMIMTKDDVIDKVSRLTKEVEGGE